MLADLDWWRVEEGQHELRGEVPPPSQLPNPADTEEEQEQVPEVISPLPSPPRDLNVNTDPLWAPLPGSGSSAVESSDFSHVHYFLGMNYETFGTTEVGLCCLH